MMTKILLTLLVIIGGVIFLRHKKSLEQPLANERNTKIINIQPELDSARQNNIKIIAISVLALTLLSGTAMLFLDWQDDHSIYEIKIVNPQTGNTDSYQAYKKDLRGRTFTTITGQQIAVSEMERLEFQEVE